MNEPRQSSVVSAEEAKQDAETHARTRGPLICGVEAEVWTERMLSALVMASTVARGKYSYHRREDRVVRVSHDLPSRDSLDEETADWRAVCGKTARTVRRAGWAKAHPDPYHEHRASTKGIEPSWPFANVTEKKEARRR